MTDPQPPQPPSPPQPSPSPQPSPPTPRTDLVPVNGAGDVHGDLARKIGEITGDTHPSPTKVKDAIILAGRSAQHAGVKAVASGRWLADIVIQTGGHIPVRDLDTLIDHYDGKQGPALAEALVRNASRTSGAVGAATGVAVAASQLAVATWATLPVELLAETLIVVAVELKLVAELHAVAGRPFEGSATEKANAAASVWSDNQGARPGTRAKIGNLGYVARQAHRQLSATIQRRILRRAGLNLWSFLPFLIGAGVGGELNRRATLGVGRKVAGRLGLQPAALERPPR